jgi:citrate lyase subunit beta / citryl-CoA lyase
MSLPVTYLFVPASDDRKVSKAMQSGADAVILDLEDSIPDGLKDAARQQLITHLSAMPPRGGTPEVWVRINSRDPEFSADAKAIDWQAVQGAVLPKAERPQSINTLLGAGAQRVLPIIESAAGFQFLDRLGSSGNIERFAIGTFDLAIDLGIIHVSADESELIWQLRGELVLASRQLNLPPPVDGVHGQFTDNEGLLTLSRRAHSLGFGAKLLIHPRQISLVRDVFRPPDEALQHARDVVRAYDDAVSQGRGAVQLNGEMIDRPVVERARALLARWGGG